MPLIKARTEKIKAARFIAPIWVEKLETLYAYAEMIGEKPDYIVNELIAGLDKDQEFKDWRKTHPATYYQPSAKRAAKADKKPRTTPLQRAG